MDDDQAQPSSEHIEAALVDLVVESWRFSRQFLRAISRLDAKESGRYVSQLRFFLKQIEEKLAAANLKIADVEGHVYDPGMAATALNVADFGEQDRLVVDQMLEPIIMSSEGLRRPGVVMLRKVES